MSVRKFYFDSRLGLDSYAMCENGVLSEYYAEHSAVQAAVGNIYKGRVTNILNGMQAAFIDCGLERHCYLSVNDLTPDQKAFEGDMDVPDQLNLHEGDDIMVQIIKPPVGTKGAKVTTNISLVGKYIVYLPTTSFIGVSRKISDEELKKNLLYSAKTLCGEGEGIIVRTAAPYAVRKDKLTELNYFRSLFKNIKSRCECAPVGELLYSDSPLYICVLRDIMLTPADEIHVGTERLYESVGDILAVYPEGARPSVFLHDEHVDMFYTEGISEQILKTLQPKAELKNGAYIVIDKTEALTAIDVNTGKFTGKDSMESTAYQTNVLAAQEIARQIRLRNLGGIFVVDFIDMENETHNKAIVQELEKALKGDKGKCKVLPMSKFGLVEFTRKRTGPANYEIKTKQCKSCSGTGVLRSFESIALEFRAKLLEMLHGGAVTVCVDMNFETANSVLACKPLCDSISELYPQARVYIVGHRTYREAAMYFRRVDKTGFSMPEGTMLLY